MGLKYELKFIVDETGETVLLSGEFLDNERELSDEFVEHAEGVLNTKFFQSGDWGKLGIKWDENKNMKVTTELPAWDDVIVFLHKFRPLLLQNERTNFYKIHNLLARNLDHPYFRNLLGQQHEVFSGKASQSIMQFRSNDVLINSENILFDWLNSHESLHELERQEVLKAWKTTQRATEQAIGLIRSELGLVNMNILWSGALLVPIIALCATMSPRDRDSNELAGWLALAALYHRYSGSSESALDQDLRACRTPDPVGALLTNLRATRTSLVADLKDFAGGLVDRSGLLALYIACLNRGVLDFYTGGKVLLQNNVDRHHILPRAQFPEDQRPAADNIANVSFIAGDVNKSIGQSGPEVYLKKVKSKILESQCIPQDSTLWRIDQADAFWHARRQLLADSFNDYIRKSLPSRRV